MSNFSFPSDVKKPKKKSLLLLRLFNTFVMTKETKEREAKINSFLVKSSKRSSHLLPFPFLVLVRAWIEIISKRGEKKGTVEVHILVWGQHRPPTCLSLPHPFLNEINTFCR